MVIEPSTNMVFRFLLGDVIGQIQKWSSDTSTLMAAIVTPGAAALFGIYLLVFFGGVARGSVQSPVGEFGAKAIRGCMIIMFATAAGVYQDWVLDSMWTLPGAIAQEIGQPGSSSGFQASGGNLAVAKMLDSCLQSGLDAGFAAWDKMSSLHIISSLGYGLLALCIWVFVALVCAYAAALVMVANIGMAVMLALGPLCIVLAIFESTQQIFVAWTRQLLTFAFFFIILSAVMSLTFSFFAPFLTKIATMSKSEVIIAFVLTIVICAAAVLALWQVQTWASGIAGGTAITSANAIGRMVSGGTRMIAHSHYDPNKENRDGTRGGHRLRGAVPSTINAARAAGRVASAYLRTNKMSKRD